MELFLAFLGGIAAGYVGAAGGSGGLIGLPVLLYLNLSAAVAIATIRFSAMGLMAAAIPRYYASGAINWKLALKLMPLAVIGGTIGAQTLVSIEERTTNLVLSAFLILLLPMLFLNKSQGLESSTTSQSKQYSGYVFYFLTMIVGGLIGAGTLVIILTGLLYFFGVSYLEGVATSFVPWFAFSSVVLTIFMFERIVDYRLGLAMGMGMAVGGRVGAEHAIEKGSTWIRLIFGLSVTASVIKLVVFS